MTQEGICGIYKDRVNMYIYNCYTEVSSHIYRFTIRQLWHKYWKSQLAHLQVFLSVNLLIKISFELGALHKHVQNMWLLRVHGIYRVHTKSKMLGSISPGNSPCFPWPLSPELCPIAASMKSLRQCRWWDLQIPWLSIIDFFFSSSSSWATATGRMHAP